jgi:hypothetical protein
MTKNDAKKHKKNENEWKILTLMACFILSLNKPKKNEERQHTSGWKETRMLDFGMRMRERKRKRERERELETIV